MYLASRARRALDELPTKIRDRIESKITELMSTPYPTGCRKLKGIPHSYRLRAGDYRILYSSARYDEIIVFKIDHRKSVYD